LRGGGKKEARPTTFSKEKKKKGKNAIMFPASNEKRRRVGKGVGRPDRGGKRKSTRNWDGRGKIAP